MKDKKNYLKIACLIEVIYIIFTAVYYLFFTKFNEEVVAKLFMLTISIFFTIILYKESKKDINYLKENKSKIIISSIWMFLEPIVPGVLGFFFISSISDKKEKSLPIINHDKIGAKDKIKSLVTLFFFLVIMFVLPNFKIFNKIPAFIIYIFIIFVIFVFYHKELISDFKVFIKNFKTYLPFVIKRYFIMLGIMFIVAVPIVFLNSGQTSSNQEIINSMFKKVPLVTFILSVFYAPLAEESVFRLSLSKLFNNKTLFIIVSGFLFGSLHMIDKFTSFYDLLYIFQYSTLGMCLAKAYSDSNNIFVPMSMHFIQNFLAAVLVLLLF